jgi:uncharacterized protein
MLIDAYGSNAKMLSLSMVYTPPYSEERLSRIAELWNQYSWLPNNIRVSVAYPVGFYLKERDDSNKGKLELSYFEWAKKKFIEAYNKGTESHPMASGLIEKNLLRLYKRPIYSSPINKYFLNGCCIPAKRKQFVSVDGTLVLCEKVGTAPVIGNIINGVDVNLVKRKFIDEYAELSIEECSNCWARQICSICYMHAYKGERFDNVTKSGYCALTRTSTIRALMLYCKLLEINKTGLDYLADFTVS